MFQPLPTHTERKVGFEFEYTGIPIAEAAGILAKHFDGTIENKSEIDYRVCDSLLGDIKIESDFFLAQQIANQSWDELPSPVGNLLKKALELYGNHETFVVPWEIVTSPLSHNQFPLLEEMRELLHDARAKGTHDSFAFAFGTHINCEIPSEKVEDTLNITRAFITLYPKFLETLDIHPTRRILSFIKPFPKEYEKIIMEDSYTPDWEQFIEDYLKFNNSRNRALDLLPLLVHLFPDVKEKINKDSRHLVKPRPTYHYRLPNCDFGDKNWRVADVWNSWVKIERLAYI